MPTDAIVVSIIIYWPLIKFFTTKTTTCTINVHYAYMYHVMIGIAQLNALSGAKMCHFVEAARHDLMTH